MNKGLITISSHAGIKALDKQTSEKKIGFKPERPFLKLSVLKSDATLLSGTPNEKVLGVQSEKESRILDFNFFSSKNSENSLIKQIIHIAFEKNRRFHFFSLSRNVTLNYVTVRITRF